MAITDRVAREATDLLAPDNLFKRIVEASPDTVLMFEPDTLRVTYANPAAADLIGIGADDWIGRSVMDLQPQLPESDFRVTVRALA